MYGNNIGGPFIMPNSMPYGPMMRSAPIMGTANMMNGAPMMGATRSGGLSSLLGLGRGIRGTSTLAGTHSLNLGSILSGASKALGVVNQAIPIVKEVGPMMNNMKSMLKIASIFKDETDRTTSTKNTINNEEKKSSTNSIKEANSEKEKSNDTNITISTKEITNNEPNFFL